MKKDFLILQACGHSDEKFEIENIKAQAELYEMNVVSKCIRNYDCLEKALIENGEFDYVYLSFKQFSTARSISRNGLYLWIQRFIVDSTSITELLFISSQY